MQNDTPSSADQPAMPQPAPDLPRAVTDSAPQAGPMAAPASADPAATVSPAGGPAPVGPEQSTVMPDEPAAAPAAWASKPEPTMPGMPVTVPAATAATTRRKVPLKLMIIIAIVAVMLIGTGVAAFALLVHPISKADIIKAEGAGSNLDSDLLSAGSTYNDIIIGSGSDTSAATITSSVNTITAKLDDAQKQLNLLKQSPVMGDPTVAAKFNALQVKLTPYAAYIRSNTSDYSILLPIINNFSDKLNTLLTNVPTTTGDISAYLTNLKTITDTTGKQLAGVTMQNSLNQQGVTALKTLLGSTSAAISKTQADMSAGKDVLVLQDDLFSLETPSQAYEKAISNLNTQSENKLQDLDASNAFSDFMTAVATLGTKYN